MPWSKTLGLHAWNISVVSCWERGWEAIKWRDTSSSFRYGRVMRPQDPIDCGIEFIVSSPSWFGGMSIKSLFTVSNFLICDVTDLCFEIVRTWPRLVLWSSDSETLHYQRRNSLASIHKSKDFWSSSGSHGYILDNFGGMSIKSPCLHFVIF